MCLLLLIIETFTTPKKLLYQDVSSFSEYEKTLFQRIRTIDDAVKEVKAMSQKENTRRSLVVNAFILLSRISSNPMLVQKRCDGIIEDCSGERTARHTIRSNYILWFLGKFVDIVPHFRKDVLRYRYSRLEILADILKWCLPLLLLLSPAIHRTILNKFMA